MKSWTPQRRLRLLHGICRYTNAGAIGAVALFWLTRWGGWWIAGGLAVVVVSCIGFWWSERQLWRARLEALRTGRDD